jgi:oligopeptidase B
MNEKTDLAAAPAAEAPDSAPAAPVAKRVDFEITQVGRTRVDPYHWMKDDAWQEVMRDPSVLRADIREYLEAENAYTKTNFEEPTAELRETLFQEMKGRIKEDDSTVPEIDGPYAYYSRYREGGEYPIIARKNAADAFTRMPKRPSCSTATRWRKAPTISRSAASIPHRIIA